MSLVGDYAQHYNHEMGRSILVCRGIAAIFLCLPALSSAGTREDNAKLQNAIAQTMAGQRGTAVVLDFHSGRMLAAYHASVAARRVARPGSSIKPFTLLALLQAGTVDMHTALVCKRPLTIAGHQLDCIHPDNPSHSGQAPPLLV